MQQFANLITLTTKIKIYNFTKSSIQLLKIPQQLSRNTHHNPTSLSNSLYQKCEECVKSKLLVYAAFNSPLPSSRFNYQLKFVVISTKAKSCRVVNCNLLVFFFFGNLRVIMSKILAIYDRKKFGVVILRKFLLCLILILYIIIYLDLYKK